MLLGQPVEHPGVEVEGLGYDLGHDRRVFVLGGRGGNRLNEVVGGRQIRLPRPDRPQRDLLGPIQLEVLADCDAHGAGQQRLQRDLERAAHVDLDPLVPVCHQAPDLDVASQARHLLHVAPVEGANTAYVQQNLGIDSHHGPTTLERIAGGLSVEREVVSTRHGRVDMSASL